MNCSKTRTRIVLVFTILCQLGFLAVFSDAFAAGSADPGRIAIGQNERAATEGTGEKEVFSNFNKSSVANNPKYVPDFFVDESTLISRITNYHWNNGKGAYPGTIALIDEDGKIYGPWQARGTDGMYDTKNANWIVEPNIMIPSGRYFIFDSDMATWSNNAGSAYCGFSEVMSGSGLQSEESENTGSGNYINVAGIYNTDYNEMTLYQEGNRVWGDYKYDGGKIEGTISGNTLTGTWTQKSSSGGIQFVFSEAGFAGKWTSSKTNTDFSSGRNWNGTLVSRSNVQTGDKIIKTPVTPPATNVYNVSGSYKSSWGNMQLSQSGNQVTGTYEHSGGKIKGTLSGKVLTGTWTQTNGSGQIYFEFTDEGFRGKWTYGNSTDFGTSWSWTGTRNP